jgi:hypothetical protein
MNKYIAIFTLLFVVFGCRKEADIKLPEQEEKLVVTCFVSPTDTVLTAVVRTSSPKYNVRNYNYSVAGLSDAEVTISSDQGSAVFSYDEVFMCYTLSPVSFPIYPGKKYSLTVKTPDGKHSSANTVVPTDTFHIRSFAVNMNYSSDSNNLDINSVAEIAAFNGRVNYVGMYYRQVNIPQDSSMQEYNPYDFRGYGIYEDDEKHPRESFVFKQEQGRYEGDAKSLFGGFYAEFWVLNCSKEFYLYNRTVQLASELNGNPFGDPVLVYTNMDNGFGCFGAYMITKRSISR